MAENTKIQWCHHTFNPWRGCAKVSAACANCYAEAQAKRNPGVLGVWGPNGTRVVASEAAWKEPIKWNRAAIAAGERRRVFCASMADVFESWAQEIRSQGLVAHICENQHTSWTDAVCAYGLPCASCDLIARPLTMDDIRRRLFALIDATPHLDWLLLTKRPERIRDCWHLGGIPHLEAPQKSPEETAREWCNRLVRTQLRRHNVWLLTSAGTQAEADKYIPELLKCRDLAPVLGVSCEPLLEAVDLTRYFPHLDWVIVGGESGRGARPCDVAWIRSIRDQCKTAGVACFVKQLGSKSIGWHPFATADKKGGDPDEWPKDLRVREFPNV